MPFPPHLKYVATLPCEIFGTFSTNSSQWPEFFLHHTVRGWTIDHSSALCG